MRSLLNLADNLAGLGKRLNHLLALFPPSGCEVALLQQVVELIGSVHVLQKLLLHFVLGESVKLVSKGLGNVVEADLLDEGKHDGLGDHIDHGTLHNIVVRSNQQLFTWVSTVPMNHIDQMNSLITSTSMFSRSDRVPEAFRVGGGGSMAAAFFLFLAAKKLPKKPELELPSASGIAGLAARAGVEAGRGLPVLGSTWTGFAGLYRSFTIAIA